MNRRLMFSYLAIAAFFIMILEIPLAASFASDKRDQVSDRLSRDAKVLAALVEDSLASGIAIDAAIINSYQVASGSRAVVVDKTGVSVADSQDPIGRDYKSQDEITRALNGTFSTGKVQSSATGDLMYVAAPVGSGDSVSGAVRVTFPSSKIDNEIRSRWLILGLLGVIALGAVAGLGFLLTRVLTAPLDMLRTAGAGFLVGERDIRVPPSDSPELNEIVSTFNQMADHIEALESAQFETMVALERSFVDNASEPLRTPLLTLGKHLANLEVTVIPEAREELDAAIAQTEKLTTLVDQLLALAEIDATGAGKAESIELVDAITKRCESWHQRAGERGITLRLEPSNPCWAWVAPGALDQMLDNLIDNAIAAGPTGTAVTIRIENKSDFVGVHVIDQGPGMDEQERILAFERFWQGQETDWKGTSGLGLTIVAQLAKASNGVAGLSPVPEGGLDAWIQLPHPKVDLSDAEISRDKYHV